MSLLSWIFKGTTANDKTGTPARIAADIINQNFAYLDAKVNNSDHVVTLGTSVLVDQDLTIHAGWVWQINGIEYTNPVDVIINFPFCSSGKQRLDRIVFNTSNTFTKVAGTESVSNPVATPAPVDTIEFGITLVTDGTVGDPSTPIEGGNYVKKMESQDFIASYGVMAIIEKIDLIDDRSSILLTGAITDVKSIQMSGEFIRPGKPFFIKNSTGHDVKLWQLAGTGNVKISFPNALDLIVRDKEVIQFKQNANDSSDVRLDYIGNILDLSGKADLVAGKVPSSQLPSYVDDILEGYLLSNVFYEEIGHTTVIPAEAGKIYIDITTGQKNKEYRYSGSTYIQITNGLIASADDVPDGSTNKYSTLSLVMGYLLTGVSFATGTAITAADNILTAFGKLQKQISDNVASIALKQVKDDQVEISANSNVQNSWHGQTILFTANCTITVPSTLNNSLMFPFRTLAGVTVTWAITSPFIWETTPLATGEKTVGYFMRRGSTNTIFLDV
ncbi:hypothetical protein [Flavobacterium sp. ASV13]|uniref:hypothetical protein n=1 Tax=Flavobacterium sp. ASV13 TaxID=1506583 RepID=UPI000556EA71|nr:hypothetical protein [Flavobacterium sp. ASV13]